MVRGLALIGSLLLVSGCSSASAAHSPTHTGTTGSICAGRPSGLTPVASTTPSTLPVSHDNDVGRRRNADLYPDADQDANQVPQVEHCRPS